MSARKHVVILLVLLSTVSMLGAWAKTKAASDGLPTGQDSPEGAATDLARAFMIGDSDWFRRVCIRPYASAQSNSEYVDYLNGVAQHLKVDNKKSVPDNPTKIVRVYDARHLSKSGPASYGNASFGFRDVMFVDIEVQSRNGKSLVRRTLVIQDKDGRWYVHPVPDMSPLLCDGLWDESASTKSFGQ